MKSIIGSHMDPAILESGTTAKMTFKKNVRWEDSFIEVWEFEEDEFEEFKAWAGKFNEYDWSEEFPGSWYRYATGSILGVPSLDFVINGKPLKLWPGADRDEGYPDEYDPSDGEYADYEEWESDAHPAEYDGIFEYFYDEMDLSQPRNVCALLADIATYNNMTIAEVLTNYVSR